MLWFKFKQIVFCFLKILTCVSGSGKTALAASPAASGGSCEAAAVHDVLFAFPGVGRAAELGQPWTSHRRCPQRPPPHGTGAASREPGGAEPRSPHAAGRPRAGPAAVPEAQGNAEHRCLKSTDLCLNPGATQEPFSSRCVGETSLQSQLGTP